MGMVTVTTLGCREYLQHRGYATFGELVFKSERRHLVSEIQRTVAQFYRLPIEQMRSHCRAREYARPRQVAMYLCRRNTCMSLPQIGLRFDRDHTTVLHAIRQIERLKMDDAELARDVANLQSQMEAA
jgi:chromosomal replication initiator protein